MSLDCGYWKDEDRPDRDHGWYKRGYRYVPMSCKEILRCPRCFALVVEEDWKRHEQWCKSK